MSLVNVQGIISDLLANADVIASLGAVAAALLFNKVVSSFRSA